MPASGKLTFEATIQPWGNSLGLRITRPMCDLARLGRGDKVLVEVDENGMTVRRMTRGRGLEPPLLRSRSNRGHDTLLRPR
jgi:hypothetical protein